MMSMEQVEEAMKRLEIEIRGNENVQQAPSPAPAAMTEVDIQDVDGVPQPAANPSQSQAQPLLQGPRVRAMWQGTIHAIGASLETKFDVEVFSASVLDTRVWPSVMNIVPSLITTKDELKMYLKTNYAILCQVYPLKPSARAEMNVYRYEQLTNLLLTKSACALATWNHPDDNQKYLNFLIFTLITSTGDEKKTFGAFWTSDGPPNVPRRLPGTVPAAPSNIDPNQISMNARQQLRQIPPERRAAIIQQLMAKRLMIQSQMEYLQNQAGPSSQPMQQVENPNVANPFTGSNMATFMNMDGGGHGAEPGEHYAGAESPRTARYGGNPIMSMPQGMGPNMNG